MGIDSDLKIRSGGERIKTHVIFWVPLGMPGLQREAGELVNRAHQRSDVIF